MLCFLSTLSPYCNPSLMEREKADPAPQVAMENHENEPLPELLRLTKWGQENSYLYKTCSPAVKLKKRKAFNFLFYVYCNNSQLQIEMDKNLCNFLTRHSSVVLDAFL